MAFVKLDTGILDSTLWIERDQRELFITALLMAEPREFTQPMRQIKIGELEWTDFEAPPGWYGFVPAASFGIINRAGVEREAGMEGLRRLGEPEVESRSKEFEGRRMIRVNGGFLILNFMRYRDKDHTAAERQRRLRARRKEQQDKEDVTRDVQGVTRDATLPERNITEADSRVQSADELKSSSAPLQPILPDGRSDAPKSRKVAFELPPWIDVGIWEDYEEMRRKKRAGMTDSVRVRIVQKLTSIRDSGSDPIEALETSIRSSWTDVYSPKGEKKNGRIESNVEILRQSLARESNQDRTNGSALLQGGGDDACLSGIDDGEIGD